MDDFFKIVFELNDFSLKYLSEKDLIKLSMSCKYVHHWLNRRAELRFKTKYPHLIKIDFNIVKEKYGCWLSLFLVFKREYFPSCILRNLKLISNQQNTEGMIFLDFDKFSKSESNKEVRLIKITTIEEL